MLVRDPHWRPDVTQIRKKLSTIMATTFCKQNESREKGYPSSAGMSYHNLKCQSWPLPFPQGRPASVLHAPLIGLERQPTPGICDEFHLQNDSFPLDHLQFTLTFLSKPRLEILAFSEALHKSFNESCFDAVLVCGKLPNDRGSCDFKSLECNNHAKLYSKAISCGIAAQTIDLPYPTARGHDVQLQFAAVISSAVSFARRIRLGSQAKLAIICEQADVSMAAVVAIAIQVDIDGGDIRSNIFNCSNKDAYGKMHATNLARLCAWETGLRAMSNYH